MFLKRVYRLKSTESFNNLNMIKTWLSNLCLDNLPPKLYTTHYNRSSGPGGQSVNKTNSKCTVTINNFSKSSWFPVEIRRQMLHHNFRYYAKNKDALVIQSDTTRSREINKKICLQKMIQEIKNIIIIPKPVDQKDIERWVEIKQSTNDIRLKSKRLKSDKKKLRLKQFDY